MIVGLGWRHVWSRTLKLAIFCREVRSTSDFIVVARQNSVVVLSCGYKKIVDFAMICRGCDLFGRAQACALLSRVRDVWFGSLIYLFSCNLSN